MCPLASMRSNPNSGAGRPSATKRPDRVAEFVLYLLTLPRDAFLLNPLLYALRPRSRRGTADRS